LRKQQPGTGLSDAGFHALIRGVFAAALQRNFDAGGIVGCGSRNPHWNQTLLAQSSRDYVERESKIIRFPGKGLGNI
jgi:hypothetical protein